jgi:Peptidase family M48
MMRIVLALIVTFVALSPVDAHAQQTATLLADAPIYLLPDVYRQPLLVAGAGSTADIIRAEGVWFRISFEDSRGQTRVGYIQAKFVKVSEPTALPTTATPKTPAPQQTTPAARIPTPSPRPDAPAAAPSPTPQRTTTPAATPQSATASSTTNTPPPPTRVPAATSNARLKNTKIRGYVTEFRSPTDFDIEDYRITREDTFALDFENASPDITFKLQDIRVGVELEIKGSLNEETGELKAEAIKVDLEQFKSIKQTAFVSSAPEGLQLLDGSWAGELRADGQVIRVINGTAVVFKPTKREKKLAEQKKKNAETEDEEDFEALKSLDQVTVGMAMTYEGKRDRETGKILAERIEFSTNDLEDGEAKMWKSLKTSVKTAQGLRPGELKIDKVGKFKLLPDAEVQAYIDTLGQRLIPAYQRNLPVGDPRKIPFQFHVVQNKSVNAFATPNGIIVVNSGLMEMVENEAQLAAVVGHEIAHATHEHTWRQQQYHKKKRLGIAIAGAVASAYGMHSLADMATLVNGAIVNGHQRVLENQSDRIGLQYMIDAGYDPRQAPAVWKLMARTNGVQVTDFFWSRHDNAPTRRSYLMNELKNNYRDIDYSPLRMNAEDYSRIKAAVTAANGQKKKIKVRQ